MPRSRRSSTSASRPLAAIASKRGGRLPAVAQPRAGLRLDHHHAHAVGDDVVQLAGDPTALLGDHRPHALLALAFELLRTIAQQLDQLLAAAHGAAGEPRDGGEERGGHGVLIACAGGIGPGHPGDHSRDAQ